MKQQTAAISKAPLRILACMLSLLLGMLLWSGSTLSASASQVGDVDGDGFITVQDATLILEMYAKTSADISMNLSNEMVTTADVDDDGMICVMSLWFWNITPNKQPVWRSTGIFCSNLKPKKLPGSVLKKFWSMLISIGQKMVFLHFLTMKPCIRLLLSGQRN